MVNDLLDPGRPALRLREDRRRGSYVEGAREETLLDADHALALIAAGDANRKVRLCNPVQSLRSYRGHRLSLASEGEFKQQHCLAYEAGRMLLVCYEEPNA